jgi:hypothetical protein
MHKPWPPYIPGFFEPTAKDGSGVIGLDQLEIILKTLFSWFFLMPIAVIISGILLSKPFNLQIETDQRFRIPVPRIFNLEANNGEVVLGFAGFIITLVILGVTGGEYIYIFFRSHFGIDPGQFNSLCILSSFITVLWSSILWVLHKARTSSPDPAAIERDQKIIKLSNQYKGGN